MKRKPKEKKINAEVATEATVVVPEARIVPRIPTELRTIVQIKESEEDTWKELTNVTTASRNGAGFISSRKCSIGRLVRLVIPMPVELRAYDLAEEYYPIMGVVQYCNKEENDDGDLYHVGVALIGKKVPASYNENPLQSYRISGMSADGLWNVTEAETEFKARRHPRFRTELNVTITLLQKEEKLVTKETTITQDIGANGASVVCSLNAKVGDKVKFACKDLNFYAMAQVRNLRKKEGEVTTLHLEFVENRFPVEKLRSLHHSTNPGPVEPPPVVEAPMPAPPTVVEAAEPPPVVEAPMPAPPVSPDVRDFEFERF